MTRDEAIRAVIKKAEKFGLKGGYNEVSGSYWVSVTGKPGYTHITITEKTDRERCDYQKFIYAGHFEVSAEVSRMGGNPDAEELFQAAAQISLAAGFVKACGEEDFSYRQDANGDAV